MLNLFPYTNIHNLNLDWIIRRIKAAVFSVNGYTPDDNGNVQLPTVPTVSSVNGQQGAVVLDAADVGAIPDTVTVPTLTSQLVNDSGYITAAQAGAVSSVNGEVGDVVLDAADVGATPAGQGIPAGGTDGQVLVKNGSPNYSASWTDYDTFKAGDTVNFTRMVSNFMAAGGSAISFQISLHKRIPSGLSVRINNPVLNNLRGQGSDIAAGYNSFNSVIVEDDHDLQLVFSHIAGQATGTANQVYCGQISGQVEFYV